LIQTRNITNPGTDLEIDREAHTGTITSAKLAKRKQMKRLQTQGLFLYQIRTPYLVPEGLWFRYGEVLHNRIENFAIAP
jgi:hypothetical protein